MVQLSQEGINCDLRVRPGGMLFEQRNDLVHSFCEAGTDMVLFIDTDMVIDAKLVKELIKLDKDIVGGICRLTGAPYGFTVFEASPEAGDGYYFLRMNEATMPKEPFCTGSDGNDIGIGTGVMLVKIDVLKEMSKPENVKQYGLPFNHWQRLDGVQIGEDISFCTRAKKLGFKVWAHPGVNIGHIGKNLIWTYDKKEDDDEPS